MTVTYSLNVANAKLTGFSRLLLRWKASIYKLLYREVIIFCVCYYMLSLSYRYILNQHQKLVFEKTVEYCRTFTSVIPLSFVLGFYVSIVVTRWWQQFMQIPWPDKAVLLISGYVRGDDERGRIIRRTLARYLILMQVLTFQAVSTSVRRRFPTLDHIQSVGLFTNEERVAYDRICGSHGKWWAPAQWFISLIIRARASGRIRHDYLMDKIIDELHVYRSYCGMMFAYDWISIPLVYTQTVTIATYMYFVAAMIGRQYLDSREGQSTTSNDVDYYIPVFTILEFLCFMGWLKVAEQLINPYGEDDDDFELNWCLDRNLLISLTIVDQMYGEHPKLVRDIFWDKREPYLPYTKSSLNTKLSNLHPHSGSTIDLNIEPEGFLPMETIMEDDREDYNFISTPNTSMFDYDTQPKWFQNHNQTSTIEIDNENELKQQTNPLLNPTNYQGDSNVSRNHSELIESLKAENSSRNSNRSNGFKRFIPKFLEDTKFVNKFINRNEKQSQTTNIPANQYQNYSNLRKHAHFQHQHSEQSQNSQHSEQTQNAFVLRTPTNKKRQYQHQTSINESANRFHQQNQPNQQQNQSYLAANSSNLMNASNNSIGYLNTMHNSFNKSFSSATVNGPNSSHQNLVNYSLEDSQQLHNNNAANSVTKRNRQLPHRLENDDLTSSKDDERFETGTRLRSNRPSLNRLSTLSQPPLSARLPHKFDNLRTAPVLGTFNNSNNNTTACKNKISPLMSRLRTSLNNFSAHHYRNFNRLNSRNKRNSFSSSISLKSKCDQPTTDQLVTPNGFCWPQSNIPPKNLNQYLPLHLKPSLENSSILSDDQEIDDESNNNKSNNNKSNNNKSNNVSNLNRESHVTIQISPASNKDLNSKRDSLENLKEEEIEDSNYNTITKVAEILKSKNENEFNSVKPKVNNQDSSDTLTTNQSDDDDDDDDELLTPSAELNDQEIKNNENENLINKNLTLSLNEQKANQEEDDETCYTPTEDKFEEKYDESSISSNDSLLPYESNQNTISSYTQLLENKDKNKEY